MTRSSSRSTNTNAANIADTSTSRIQIRSGKWSEEERKLFFKGIEKYGRGNWKKIANEVVLTRTAAQVKNYAQNHCPDPNLIKEGTKAAGRWTRQEEILFEKGLKEYGKGKWKKIAAEYVKTRSAAQVFRHAQTYFDRTVRNSIQLLGISL